MATCPTRFAPRRFGIRSARCRFSVAAILATIMGIAAPAAAQQETSEAQQPSEIQFEAERLDYVNASDIVTATGNVIVNRGNQSVRADKIVWDRKTGKITAEGNIRFVDVDGNQLYTDSLELTEELRDGAMENILLVMREGGRLAANSGVRTDGVVTLNSAAYTACAVEDAQGCPKDPSWQIKAVKVSYDPVAQRVRYEGARLEIFGLPLIPLPGLSHPTGAQSGTGLLVPDVRFSAANGVEISQPYYLRLADNRDLTLTASVFTETLPMISARYRALTSRGAYQATGYATFSRRIDAATASRNSTYRGYFESNGRFQLGNDWTIAGSLRAVTDRTFLRRYDISRDDRLRSNITAERIRADSYLQIAGWATQTLRTGDRQGQMPIALPAIDYRRRLTDPVIGGRVELQANSLAILRSSGQDSQRAFASARWDLRRLTTMGQEITVTGLLRGDVYNSRQNDLTSTLIYRGDKGWQARGIGLVAIDAKWPLAGPLWGGTQVLTPRLQIVGTPKIRNLAVPNEDSRAIDLEDTNLFSLNRFPGYDRFEDGVRFTYGLDWQLERPKWRINASIGQSYRLTTEPTILPDGTGLTNQTSDIVGRTEVRFRDRVKLTHRYRLDKDSLAVRRNEFDLTFGNRQTYGEIGYLRLNRDITSVEDLFDREEIRVAGRVAFARYWSVFGSSIYNLTDRSEDPTNQSDGLEPVRTRLGIAYSDDCIEMSVTWRRDFVTTGDAERGNTFLLRFALRNLGF